MNDKARKLDLGDKPENLKTTSGWDYLSNGGPIRCAFTTSTEEVVRLGDASKTRESLNYWYVEQVEDELFEVRMINTKCVPFGDAESVPLHQLVNEYTPQVEFYEDEMLPAMQKLDGIIDEADRLREEERLYSSELEYGRALDMEEKNVRALFGLGLIFASRREMERTRGVLNDLVALKAPFEGKNQHLFNEFGIALRKIGLFQEAVAYYRRGLDFIDTDENLFYNLARAHYENNNWTGCIEALILCNKLNPDLELARDLFEVIVGLADDERRLERYGKPPVPKEVAAKARNILKSERAKVPQDKGPIFDVAQGRARSGKSTDDGNFNLDLLIDD